MITRTLLAFLVATLLPSAAFAVDEKVRIELNKLESQGQVCQAYILIQNETELAFSALSLDLVMFDPDGIISKRLAVEMAPLRAGKTSVKVFGIDGAACGGLGRILVNDVLSCEVGGSARNDCLEMIETASRGPVDLIN